MEKNDFALSRIIDITDMDNADGTKDCYSIELNDDNDFRDGLDPFDFQQLNQVTFKLELANVQ